MAQAASRNGWVTWCHIRSGSSFLAVTSAARPVLRPQPVRPQKQSGSACRFLRQRFGRPNPDQLTPAVGSAGQGASLALVSARKRCFRSEPRGGLSGTGSRFRALTGLIPNVRRTPGAWLRPTGWPSVPRGSDCRSCAPRPCGPSPFGLRVCLASRTTSDRTR